MQVEALQLRVEEVGIRSTSRAVSVSGEEEEGSELGESEEAMDVEVVQEQEPELVEEEERAYRRWVDERKLQEGLVDADGVRIRRMGSAPLRSRVAREVAGR